MKKKRSVTGVVVEEIVGRSLFGGSMSIHKLEDGKCVICAGGVWLPGCYEDERTARFAFRVPDEVKARLRDQAIARGDGVITWGDIAKAREELRAPNVRISGCPLFGQSD